MNFVLFSPIPYDFLHQRPQKIADRLAAKDFHVTYVEPNAWRDYLDGKRQGIAREIVRSLKYLTFLTAGKNGPKKQNVDILIKFSVVTQPLIIPINKTNSVFIDKLTAGVLRRFLEREILSRVYQDKTMIAIVEHPFWGAVLRKGDFQKIFYDCIDDLKIFAGRNSPERYGEYEERLIHMSDAVFTTAQVLEERLRKITRSVPIVKVPNGVDFEWFVTEASLANLPMDMRSMRRPIVGYVGTLSSWLEYDLLDDVAKRLSHVSFVFVGPVENQERVQRLFSNANCFWLGRKPYGEIPLYITAFDVCIIPFQRGNIARTTNPVKIFEYFALGKPVVTTPLEDLKSYKDQGLLYWAIDVEEFSVAIQDALAETDEEKKTQRRKIAQHNSWKSRIDSMLSYMIK